MHATEAGLLRREVTALMFDQYGTVVDMQGGLTGDGDAVPGRQGPGPTTRTASSPGGAARTFEDSMIDSLCDRGHTSYRQIGHRAVSQVMRRAGIDHTHERCAGSSRASSG